MKIRNLDKKTRNFLAMLFCTLVIVSTIGSSFAISNSFAQQQQTQQAPTVVYKSPWSNNLPTQTANVDPTKTTNVDPTQRNTHVSRSITLQITNPLP